MKNRLECMQPIRFLVVLLMCCLSYTTWAQTQSNVNGLVTDFSGEPLIGVSILVKGTSNGTVTDLDGKFSLSAEMGNMLQISYVGYISQEIKVESNKLLRIIMEEDTKKLEEQRRMEQMPKGSVLKQLEWATQKSQIENQQRKKNKTKYKGLEI